MRDQARSSLHGTVAGARGIWRQSRDRGKRVVMMVTALLTAAALAAPQPSAGARVEVVARATIVRGVSAREVAARPLPQVTARVRPCDTADPSRRCRLIVTDLP